MIIFIKKVIFSKHGEVERARQDRMTDKMAPRSADDRQMDPERADGMIYLVRYYLNPTGNHEVSVLQYYPMMASRRADRSFLARLLGKVADFNRDEIMGCYRKNS
jgi:hypothetical protein